MNNRIIKYQIWDEHGKRMLPWEEVKEDMDELRAIWEGHVWAKSRQFTGLLDKNGKEIYEGDIVRIKRLIANKGEEICKVEFSFGSFGIREKKSGWVDLAERFVLIEVIGNEYENPELLEKGAESPTEI